MPDAFSALSAIAAGRAEDPLAPVTVVVPSHLAGLQLRRRLAALVPFAGVRFETLPRIAELLGAGHLAAQGRSPLARPIGDYLAGQVAQEATGALGQVRDLSGFTRVLRRLFRRLRRGGIRNSQQVEGVTAGHFAEVARLYGRFREETAAFYDDEDLRDTAAQAARSRPEQVRGDLGDIYVVPPSALTAGSQTLLDALREAGGGYLELEEAATGAETRFLLAPDPASEAREVVREAVAALGSGLGLHEIAVFHGAGDQYGKLLREAFDAADVPAVYMPGVPLIDMPAGKGALALALLPERDFSRAALMDFLSLAPLRARLPGRDGPVEGLASLWDRISREAGVTHGTARWRSALGAFITDREASLEDPQVTENEARQRALGFERDHAATLREVVETLTSRLEPLRPEQPASTFVPAFKRVVSEYFAPEAKGLDDVIHEIDQLGTVGAVQGSFSLAGFAGSLQANLESASARERSLGEGILIAHYQAAAGLRFQRTVLCGAYEGALPAGPGTDPLIADSAWAELHDRYEHIEDAKERTKRAREAAERAVATAAGGELVWSAPLNEPAGTREYYPSPMMVEAARRRDAELNTASQLRRRSASAWLHRGASPLALQLAGPVVDAAELLVRDAISLRQQGVSAGAGHARWPVISMLRARRGARFTEWDGNLTALRDDGWLDLQRAVSPTSLEHYASCGFRYLCRSLLRLNAVEEPEEREMMDPAEKGTLIHGVLQSFFREQQEQGRPQVGEAWTAADVDRLLELTDEKLAEAEERGLTGLDVYSRHESRGIRADLEAFLAADTAFRRETGAVPAEFEAKIPEMTIAGARLRGFVDRIDRSPDGRRAWVIDYKTGSASAFAAIKDDPLAGGTKLQLPTYLAAAKDAEEVHAAYWFITQKAEFEQIEYAADEDGGRFERTIESILAGVRAGAFPAVPGEENEYYGGYENCRYCDFDRICQRRRDDEFAAKREDPDVAPWSRVAATARGNGPP